MVGVIYTGVSIAGDMGTVHSTSIFPFLLLGVALLTALGFEFVNGFHDTANAVATVIYTHSLEPHVAVVWSGFCNFAGRSALIGRRGVRDHLAAAGRTDSAGRKRGRVRDGIRAADRRDFLESRDVVFRAAGIEFAHADWLHYRRGIANQLMNPISGTSGVDWDQAKKIGESLLISRRSVGFGGGGLLLLSKLVIRDKRLYEAPVGNEPPPFWIRALLVFTCTGVSFSHGSNDGQKGMGLIMLILVGTVPTAYALNHAVTPSQTADFMAVSQQTVQVVSKYVKPSAIVGDARHGPDALHQHEAVRRQYDAGAAAVHQRHR